MIDPAPPGLDLGPDANVLVYVGLDLVGDGLMKLPFVRALRDAFPDGELVWLAGQGRSAYNGPLAPLVDYLLDEVIDDIPVGNGLLELFGRPLAGREFDLVIDTQRSVKTSLAVKRIRSGAFISGAADFLLSSVKPPKGYQRPSALAPQLIDLLQLATGTPPNPDAELILSPQIEELAGALLPPGFSYVAIAPGAGGIHKCWPLTEFVTVGNALANNDRVPVFILGPNEREWHDDLAAALPRALFPLQHPQLGKNAFRADLTVALARRCQAGLANDSGGGHMLAASGIPMVSLFGPTDPAKFAPHAAQLTVLRAQQWGGAEMRLIPAKAVLQALWQFLTIRVKG